MGVLHTRGMTFFRGKDSNSSAQRVSLAKYAASFTRKPLWRVGVMVLCVGVVSACAPPEQQVAQVDKRPAAVTQTESTVTFVDPLALVSVEAEQTFRYAADVVDGRCSGVSPDSFLSAESMRKLRLTEAEVLALRHQTKLVWLNDTTEQDVAHITATINGVQSGTLFEPWGTYLGEAERWGTQCDGKGFAEIFGTSTPVGGPPLPFTDPESLHTYMTAVQQDPGVVAAREKWASCFTAATGVETDPGFMSTLSLLDESESGPKAVYSDEVWGCFAESKLADASGAAQQKWQAANRAIVQQWHKDAAFYAEKLPAAQAIIDREEANTN